MVLAAATVTSLQKSSHDTIIVDPGRSLKSQTTSKPPFAIALALRKESSFKKKKKTHRAGASHYCISANFSKYVLP
jgi:hypothetical protein